MDYWQLSLTIHGSVHGVSFRWYAREEAQQLGLVGWVKNNSDGTVGVVAQGEKPALEKLRAWCKNGPRWARVERVEEEWNEKGQLEFTNFSIRY